MPERTHDVSSGANSSQLPLEVLLPIAVSFLIFLSLAAVVAHRMCKKAVARRKALASTPSLLLFTDPEANRQWLADLKCVKELGLGRLKKTKRTFSLGLDWKCRGEGRFDDDESLLSFHARPHSVFFLKGRTRSSSRTVSRRSWIQTAFHSGYERFLDGKPSSMRSTETIPEIHIRVPSMVADEASALLPQNRRWSRIIERDIGIANDGLSMLRTPCHIIDTRATATFLPSPNLTNTKRTRHPPSSMQTLPPPARRRLSYVSMSDDMTQGLNVHMPLRSLSTIQELQESCSSLDGADSRSILTGEFSGIDRLDSVRTTRTSKTQDSLVPTCGQEPLHSPHSLHRTVNDLSEAHAADIISLEGGDTERPSSIGFISVSHLTSSFQLSAGASDKPACSKIGSLRSLLSFPSETGSTQLLCDNRSDFFNALSASLPWNSFETDDFSCQRDSSDIGAFFKHSFPSSALDLASSSRPKTLIPSVHIDATLKCFPHPHCPLVTVQSISLLLQRNCLPVKLLMQCKVGNR